MKVPNEKGKRIIALSNMFTREKLEFICNRVIELTEIRKEKGSFLFEFKTNDPLGFRDFLQIGMYLRNRKIVYLLTKTTFLQRLFCDKKNRNHF
jgi:hypothetical protein